MKHAVHQKRDAELLNVNMHQTQRSFNYITATGSHRLKCGADFTVNSAVFCVFNSDHIYT